MNVLIIGSEGFIGNHCVDFFIKNKDNVTGLDLFEQPVKRYRYYKVSRLSPEFEEIFEKQQFDAVINAAGSGNVPYSMTHPLSDFEANCLDTIRVLDAIRKHQHACKYIHLSSAAVYGNPQKLPIQEEDVTLPLSPYGWHKLAAEHLCREYTTVYHLQTAIVRPFSVYGPGLKKQLFWDLHQKLGTANGSIELFGNGKESRDYIYVKDLIEAIALILSKGAMKGEAYNLASGVETTIEQVVQLFFKELSVSTAFHFNGKAREGDPLHWRADTQKISKLGYTGNTGLQTGLSEVAKWLKTLKD